MRLKTWQIILIAALLLIGIPLIVYFGVFDTFTVVQDTSWQMLIPKGTYMELRRQLISDKYRLRVKTIDSFDVGDGEYLVTFLQKLDTGGIIFTTPVVTSVFYSYNLNIKDELINSKVYGISTVNDKQYLDHLFYSDSASAWVDAAKSAVSETEKIAFIYSNQTQREAQAVFDELGSEHVEPFDRDEHNSLFVSDIRLSLNEKNLNVILCPYVENLFTFFREIIKGEQWITDYRFADVIPKENYKGCVAPDIYSSVKEYLNDNPDEFSELYYVYREAHKGIF